MLEPELLVEGLRIVAQSAEQLTGPLGQDLGRLWHVSGSDGQNIAAEWDRAPGRR